MKTTDYSLKLNKRKNKPPTRFTVVEMDYPNLYNPPTGFVVVKTDSPNFYKPTTRVAVVRTYSPNFYKPTTCFVVVKIKSISLDSRFVDLENTGLRAT